MKKFLSILFLFFIILSITFNTHATNEISWYFKKSNEHKQPELDKSQEFINKYNCNFLDYSHDDNNPEKVIYLTFDAGYENGNIDVILDILKEKNVTGAFFILGHVIDSAPSLVKRMSDEGHLVCNHTYSHKDMSKVTDKSEFMAELYKLEVAYNEKTGKEMSKFFRPPEGKLSEENLQLLTQNGYKTVLWSFAYADWDNSKQLSPETALKKLLNGTHNGEILLLHPTSKTNTLILGEFIDTLKSNGYRFGSLNEL